jgi:hypothetical protein
MGCQLTLFTTERARWVGVQVSGQAEQPRVLLVSAPYALKAGDAETLGGKPASAYALATPQTATSAPTSESAKPSAAVNASTNNQSSIQAAIAGSGTKNYIPLWTSSTALGNSNIFQNATNKDIGIGTATPTATLDVKGNVVFTGNQTVSGLLSVNGGTASVASATFNSAGGFILEGRSKGANEFNVDGGGNLFANGSLFTNGGIANDHFNVDSKGNVSTSGLASTGGLTVAGSTVTSSLFATFGSFGSFGMISEGAVGVGPEFKTKVVQAYLDVQGNALDTLIGDPGCGPNFAGIGFQNSYLKGCTNYALIGDNLGHTYLNSSGAGAIHLRNNNTDQMTITAAGNVGVNNSSPQAQLDVQGSGSSGFGMATDSNAWQARGAGGWIKAMAYVDPFASGGIAVTSCYNPASQWSSRNHSTLRHHAPRPQPGQQQCRLWF